MELELCCRATDASYNVQPERPEVVWNKRGLNNTSWHRVHVKLVADEDDEDGDRPRLANVERK